MLSLYNSDLLIIQSWSPHYTVTVSSLYSHSLLIIQTRCSHTMTVSSCNDIPTLCNNVFLIIQKLSQSYHYTNKIFTLYKQDLIIQSRLSRCTTRSHYTMTISLCSHELLIMQSCFPHYRDSFSSIYLQRPNKKENHPGRPVSGAD
jgi:predicted ATPase